MKTNTRIQVLLTSTLVLLAGGHKVSAQTNSNDDQIGLPTNPKNPLEPPSSTNDSSVNAINNLLPTNPITSSPAIDQPTNINNTNNYNPDGYSINYPNCSGTCVFAIGKNDRQNGWQFTTGVIWNINSPERTQAESSRMLAIAQSQKINTDSNLLLMEKLTGAISSGKIEQANGLAIILANRLGYSDHKSLIKEIKGK